MLIEGRGAIFVANNREDSFIVSQMLFERCANLLDIRIALIFDANHALVHVSYRNSREFIVE
jgi:hypothetical protein